MPNATIRTLIALTPLLSACPYDASAAGLIPVDGGYIYGDSLDGGLFIPDIDASVPDMLETPPTQQQLCMLFIGDVNNMTDYPRRAGTWIEDVKGILGKPPRNGEMHDKDTASLTYLWKGEGDEPAGITLTFEHVLFQFKGDNGGPPHGCFEPSFWLSGIQMRDGTYLPCWRWELNQPGLVPCKDCLSAGLTNQCLTDNPHPQDCYEHSVVCMSEPTKVKVAECVASSSDDSKCF